MTTKLAKLEKLLSDLQSGKYKPAEAERLLFTDGDGNEVRLNAPDAVARLRERIAAEREAGNTTT